MLQRLCMAGLAAFLTAGVALAQDGRISEDRDALRFSLSGQRIEIGRPGGVCPPACIQPMRAAAGVETLGELEVLDFLELFVADGRGLLIDARLPEGFAAATLPGAVNVPAATLRPDNIYRDDLLSALGVRSGDFSGAFDLVIFGAGADDPEVPEAVRNLLESGYPAEKLNYYRSGLAGWSALGLTVRAGG